MKARWMVLLVMVLLLAMIPALVMAQGRERAERTGTFVVRAGTPFYMPQAGAKQGPLATRPLSLPQFGPRVQVAGFKALLQEGFENSWPDGDWWVEEYSGAHDLCWGAVERNPRKGFMSAWPTAGCADGYDPNSYPNYANDMDTWMYYPMDLSGAKKGSVRFVFRNDSEFGYDYFSWCATPDYGANWYCNYHQGSTGGRWRTVNINLANVPGYGNMLGAPGFAFAWGFYSDFSVTLEGPYVDAIRIVATGP